MVLVPVSAFVSIPYLSPFHQINDLQEPRQNMFSVNCQIYTISVICLIGDETSKTTFGYKPEYKRFSLQKNFLCERLL